MIKGAASRLNGLKNLFPYGLLLSLVFSYLSKVLQVFSGFLQFQGNFVDGQKNSKYRDVAPFKINNAMLTMH